RGWNARCRTATPPPAAGSRCGSLRAPEPAMRRAGDRLSGAFGSATEATSADHAFQVKVISVRAVVVRPQNRVETPAGAPVDDPQKLPLGRCAAVPPVENADPPAVFQYERGNVDRGCGRMGRSAAAARHVAAGIAAHRLDRPQPAAKHLPRRAV